MDQGLPRFTPSNSVWNDFYAGTNFSNGVALLMSFVAVIWTMRLDFHLTRLNTCTKYRRSGYDAPFHLSEECSNANIASPRAIVLTSGIGGVFGWALQMVVAYTVVDIEAVLGSDLGQPYVFPESFLVLYSRHSEFPDVFREHIEPVFPLPFS